VRELQNVIERAVILCSDGEELQPSHLGFGGAASVSNAAASASATVAASSTHDDQEIESLGQVEKRYILRALERCGGNRTHASRKLGISIRTLRNKLKEYGITPVIDSEDAEAVDAD